MENKNNGTDRDSNETSAKQTHTIDFPRTILHSKIHRARVTGADVDYVGSISIDETLLEASGILPHERVQVVDCNNGSRLETYAIPAPAGSGIIQLNGAAAHRVEIGDLVIIMAYTELPSSQAVQFEPVVVHVNEKNEPISLEQGVTPGPVDPAHAVGPCCGGANHGAVTTCCA